jgi:hypothetical protein
VDKNSFYGKIYSEICNGFSIGRISTNKIFYFKHPSLAEHFSLYNNYELNKKIAEKKGVLCEEDKIKEAIDNDWWSHENESKINLLKKTIKNLYVTKEKLLYPSQKEGIDKQIKQNKNILISFEKDRRELIGYTAEEYAENKFLDDLLISLVYKDKNLCEPLFRSEEEFYSLSDKECNKIKNVFNQCTNSFAQDVLKKIAASGFFQNLVYLNNEPYSFWGKAVYQCSKYQIDLLVYGKMYRNTIDAYHKNDKPIPQEVMEDPDKFVDWIENQQNQKEPNKRKKNSNSKNNMVSSYVGATNKDLKSMGVKVEKLKGKSLLELAEEKGGTLEKSDYLNARENG